MQDFETMTGHQLDAIRQELGLSFNELADALEMTGAHAADTLRKMVRGKSPVTPRIAEAVRAMI